jgi:protocatechuate 3,4-dioxygenase beta subunit
MRLQAHSALLSLACLSLATPDTVQQLEERLKANPGDAPALRELHGVLMRTNDLPREESLRLRELLRRHSREASGELVPADEPGERIRISGTVRDEKGAPVGGVLVTVFQTDAQGLYSLRDKETRSMDEPNSRIFGFLLTGADGRYEFGTVRPGGYPFARPGVEGDAAWIPQHIHMIFEAQGYRRFTCGSTHSCQVVFRDDPRMTPHWQEWARSLTNPVLTLERDGAGVGRATFDVTLRRE